MTTVTLRGNPVEVAGRLPQKGDAAPALTLTGADLADVGLDAFAGKRKVLNIVPSLDTPTCATSTRKFNAEAASLADTVVLVVSADLPFAAKRFCVAEGLENVVTLSSFRSPASPPIPSDSAGNPWLRPRLSVFSPVRKFSSRAPPRWTLSVPLLTVPSPLSQQF